MGFSLYLASTCVSALSFKVHDIPQIILTRPSWSLLQELWALVHAYFTASPCSAMLNPRACSKASGSPCCIACWS
eukprot:763089-Hanusia_phi.AAC.7